MKVELLDYFGNDLMTVNVARASFDKFKNKFEDNDIKLLKYLVKHKHISPFRHPQLQFRISCCIYVERQLRKHEIGMELGLAPEPNSSINSISGRYVDFSDTYTKITEWRKQSTSSKQGSDGLVEDQKTCNEIQDDIIEICKVGYEKLIDLGVSKEQARSILPLNLNTTFIWTGSLLSFLHIFDLRLKSDTQEETRELVSEMLKEVKGLEREPFKHTLESFGY